MEETMPIKDEELEQPEAKEDVRQGKGDSVGH